MKSKKKRALPNQRQVIFINPRFQWITIALMMALSSIVILVFYATVAVFFWKLNSNGIALGLPRSSAYFQFLDREKHLMMIVFTISAGLTFAIITAVGAIYSHRVAGPLFQMQKALENMAASGQIKEIRFRSKDFFRELPEAFNAFVRSRSE